MNQITNKKSMRNRSVCFSCASLMLLALVGCGAGSVDESSMGDTLANIGGGQEESGYGATAFLEMDNRAFCSGVFVSRQVVLTAAHCVYDLDLNRMRLWVGTGSYPANNDNTFQVQQIMVHPLYANIANLGAGDVDRNLITNSRYDLAILFIGASVNNTTYSGTIATLSSTVYPVDSACSNYTFKVVGYGVNNGLEEGAGVKRSADICTSQVTQGVYKQLWRTGGQCHGDSGGPIYRKDTNEVVALVSAAYPAACDARDTFYSNALWNDVGFVQKAINCSSSPNRSQCIAPVDIAACDETGKDYAIPCAKWFLKCRNASQCPVYASEDLGEEKNDTNKLGMKEQNGLFGIFAISSEKAVVSVPMNQTDKANFLHAVQWVDTNPDDWELATRPDNFAAQPVQNGLHAWEVVCTSSMGCQINMGFNSAWLEYFADVDLCTRMAVLFLDNRADIDQVAVSYPMEDRENKVQFVQSTSGIGWQIVDKGISVVGCD